MAPSHSILVVEDSSDIRTMVHMALERAGYASTTVSTGTAALRALTTTTYQLLLIDLRLPDMSGTDLIHQITRESQVPSVILMSGAPWDEVQGVCGDLANITFLEKPFSLRALHDAITAIIQDHPPIP